MSNRFRESRFTEHLDDTIPESSKVFTDSWDDLAILKKLKINQPTVYIGTNCVTGETIVTPVPGAERRRKWTKRPQQPEIQDERPPSPKGKGKGNALPPPPLDFSSMPLPVKKSNASNTSLGQSEAVQHRRRFPWSKKQSATASTSSAQLKMHSGFDFDSSPLTGGASVATPSASSANQSSSRLPTAVPTIPSTENIASGLRRGKSLKRKIQGFIPKQNRNLKRTPAEEFPMPPPLPATPSSSGLRTPAGRATPTIGEQAESSAGTPQQQYSMERRAARHARIGAQEGQEAQPSGLQQYAVLEGSSRDIQP
ncbi:hypothetical protein KEM54_000659 [Ascosphaera aggregata]|nr:hypothetical protein KEM54_000659 [Ascosphaera aggregata]